MAGQTEKLTAKQRRFVEAYVGEAKFCAAAAARIAGYSERSARELGRRLRRDTAVAAAIAERMSELAMASGEVLARLTEIARNDAAEFIQTGDDGAAYVDLDAIAKAGKLRLIRGLRRTDFGLQIELMDAQAALVTLAKHHGLLVERHELSGPGGAPIPLALSLMGATDADEINRLLAEARADLADGSLPSEPGDVCSPATGSEVVE